MRPLQPTVRQLTPPPRRRIRRLAAVGALLGATALAGCGGGDAPSASEPAAAATPAKAADKIDIADFAFGPADIEVKAGTEISWSNDDAAAHTVTATDGADFDSGSLAQGATFTFKPTKAGTIAYVCTIHPSMKGTITVR